MHVEPCRRTAGLDPSRKGAARRVSALPDEDWPECARRRKSRKKSVPSCGRTWNRDAGPPRRLVEVGPDLLRGTSGCCAAVLRSCRSCTRAALRPLVGRLSVDNATGIVDQPRLPRFKDWTNYYNYVGVGTYRLRQRSRRTATRRMRRRRGRDRRAESWPSPVRRRVVTSDGRGDSDDPDLRPSGTHAGLAPLQIEDAPVRWGNRACLTLSASRRNPPRVA